MSRHNRSIHVELEIKTSELVREIVYNLCKRQNEVQIKEIKEFASKELHISLRGDLIANCLMGHPYTLDFQTGTIYRTRRGI